MTPPAAEVPLPTLDDVRAAARRLKGVAVRTPVLRDARLDATAGALAGGGPVEVWCKAEHLQPVGAFKLRGAYNAIVALPPDVRAGGVFTFSSGNHAQAVAWAARRLGIHATILMPTDAPAVKLEATRSHGAEVLTYDRYREDRDELGRRLAEERGLALVPPFDHPDVVAGQGTAALELFEEVGPLDTLVVPIGGGGLLAGSAVVAAALAPGCRVVGVEPAVRRAARDALAEGHPVTVEVPRTIADGQQTTAIGHLPLRVLRTLGVEVVGVDDAALERTVRRAALELRQVLEPSGAAALAVVLEGAEEGPLGGGGRVGVLLSGGNVDPRRLADLLRG
ncbi:MAG: pyridoxal-phosphate dependent enzyme [Actinomycetes bacterium]